jgi:hypothetical protein
MISMRDYFNLKTPERILMILNLLEMKSVYLKDVIDIVGKDLRCNSSNQDDLEEYLEKIDREVRSDLKYLEEVFNIRLDSNSQLVRTNL